MKTSSSNVATSPPKRKILLVDENARDLGFHSTVLRQLDCEVVACRSYEEALYRLDSVKFDFAVIDQGGPQFKGRCIFERFALLGRQVPAVVIADYAEIPVYLDAMELGAVDYLEKTPHPSELVRLIESWLRRDEPAPRGGMLIPQAESEPALDSLKG